MIIKAARCGLKAQAWPARGPIAAIMLSEKPINVVDIHDCDIGLAQSAAGYAFQALPGGDMFGGV